MRRYYYKGSQARGACQTSTDRRKLHIACLSVALLFTAALISSIWQVAAPDLSFDMAMDAPAQLDENSETQADTDSATLAETKEQPPLYPASVTLSVGKGDTLISLLTDYGIDYNEAHAAVNAMKGEFNPRQLTVGKDIQLELNPSLEDPSTPVIAALNFEVSPLLTLAVTREEDGFSLEKIEPKIVTRMVRASGDIQGSFYQTGAHLGIGARTLAELMRAYSYDVDFQRDIHPGHSMEVLMERQETEDGDRTGAAKVLFARLQLGKRDLPLYRYTDKHGDTDYYNEKGESLRKALLRTPVNGARITSRFGMRHHPILGYSKMHRGVDFGASRGTPIYAAGDGTIDYAGYKGAYGKYVRIRHNGTYSTAYAHTNGFAKGIRNGTRVKQGQIIAYVGTTGRSTGPHLHYEVLKNGKQVNPSNIKFKGGRTLTGTELASFRKSLQEIKVALSKTMEQDVAMADQLIE